MILDGTLTSTIKYYQTFPTEPIVQPDTDLAVQVPIDPADKIKPITLLALLTRMLALPKSEKQLLIVTHGNEAGLPIPPAPGSQQHAEEDNLNTLTAVGKVLQGIPNVLTQPLDKQPAAFAGLLQTAKNLDGSPIFPGAPLAKLLAPEDGDDDPDTPAKQRDRQRQAVATYQAIVEWTLNALSGKSDPLPAGVTTTGKVYLPDVTRKQLDELLDKGNKVRGRFDRIDFRGCKMGQSTRTLEVVRAYFGCRQVCAPDVLAFDGDIVVVIDANFDKDLDKSIETATRGAVAGNAPVKIDKATNKVVDYPVAQMPATRRFDTDKARPGDEVFIRMWITAIEPHHQQSWWMRTVSKANAEQFVKDKIDPDISKWAAPRTSLPMAGLWLVDDFNTPPPVVITVNPTGGPLDPVTPPPVPPAFALPRDPEYRKHLICVP
jgi:hypothetical protein